MYILFQFWTSFPNFEPICCSMSGSNCCFLIYIQISQEADMVVWFSHVFKNFPQFVVIHTVKGFCTINEAEVDIFLEFSCFICDPVDVGNLISGSSAFSKSSLNILKFTVHILLKSCLENLSITLIACVTNAIVWSFEHPLAMPLIRIVMKTDLFLSCGHCWIFQICWHIELSTFTASSLGLEIAHLEFHHLY